MFTLETRFHLSRDAIRAPNLVDRFSPDDLKQIGAHCWDGYDRDERSRQDWFRRYNAAMQLALQITEDKTFPWPNASNVIFPLISIAAMQFSSRAYSNIIQGSDVVKCRVTGEDPSGSVKDVALRIGRHMSWQCLEEDQLWEEEHDKLLLHLAIVGSAFSKTWFEMTSRCTTSQLVSAKDLVVNYYAKSLAKAPRASQILDFSRNDIYEKIEAGLFRDVRQEPWYQAPPKVEFDPEESMRTGAVPPVPDMDTPFPSIEQHCFLDLDQDGYAEPYVVTFERAQKSVLRIAARVEDEAQVDRAGADGKGRIRLIVPTQYYTKYGFVPSPDSSIYSMGFGILLGPLNETVNSAINQILDAGTMANSNGGFFAQGAKVPGGVLTFAPWEWRPVKATGDDLRKSIFQLPVREPSSVVFQLLSLIINYADRLSGSVDINVGENPGQNTPAQTSQMMSEQGMQVYSSIFKRVWRSMKNEFKLRFLVNGRTTPLQKKFGESSAVINRDDYKISPDLVVPVADPHITSKTQRLQKAVMVAERARMVPGYDLQEAERRLLQAAEIDAPEKLYPGPDKVPPLPNPKAQMEEIRGQIKMQQAKFHLQETALKLLSEQGEIRARIVKLQAEAAKLVSEVGTAKAANSVKMFDTIVEAMTKQAEMMNDQAQMMMKKAAGGESEGSGKEGMGGVAPTPGKPGVQEAASPMAGGPQGPMG